LGVSERIIVISIISYGKNSLTYDQLELRPALGNELSSEVKGSLYTCTYIYMRTAASDRGQPRCLITKAQETVQPYTTKSQKIGLYGQIPQDSIDISLIRPSIVT
jgi:hypothetical protein